MKIFIEKTNTTKEIQLETQTTVLEILKELEINPETVIISKNSNLITQEAKLDDDDSIEILQVISGG